MRQNITQEVTATKKSFQVTSNETYSDNSSRMVSCTPDRGRRPFVGRELNRRAPSERIEHLSFRLHVCLHSGDG